MIVKVQSRFDLNTRLTEVVEALQSAEQTEPRQGILISRLSADKFTVRLSGEVPWGLTYEDDQWRRPLMPKE